jgi:hypothetical protein
LPIGNTNDCVVECAYGLLFTRADDHKKQVPRWPVILHIYLQFVFCLMICVTHVSATFQTYFYIIEETVPFSFINLGLVLIDEDTYLLLLGKPIIRLMILH